MGSATLSKNGKRTNSLAFARVDCYTCASLGEQCDRRRPRCSVCLDRGRRCQGFVTPLSWDPKRMLSNNPSTTIVAENALNGPASQENSSTAIELSIPTHQAESTTQCLSQSFQFIKGPSKPRKKRRTRPPRTHNRAENQPGVRVNLPSPALPTYLPEEEAGLIDHDPSGNSLLNGLGMLLCLSGFCLGINSWPLSVCIPLM